MPLSARIRHHHKNYPKKIVEDRNGFRFYVTAENKKLYWLQRKVHLSPISKAHQPKLDNSSFFRNDGRSNSMFW